MRTACEDRIKTKGIDSSAKMLKYLNSKYTTPEAMALLQRQKGLIAYYFPRWKYTDDDLNFFFNYIKNKITADYLKNSKKSGGLDRWFKMINDIGKNETVPADITIEIK